MDAALQHAKYIRLTTFRKDGREVSTPVWLVPLDGKLYFRTSSASGKVKRIRATHRVRVAPSDIRGNPRGPAVDGTGRVADDPALGQRVRAALAAKYGIQQRIMQLVSWVSRERDFVVIELSL